MTIIYPLTQDFSVARQDGKPSPEFKGMMDSLMSRVFGVYGGSFSTLADGASVVWDVGRNPISRLVLGGNRAIVPTGMVAGPLSLYRLILRQDGTGSRTVTWNSNVKFPGGIPPTLTTTANATDLFMFDSDGVNLLLVGGALDLS